MSVAEAGELYKRAGGREGGIFSIIDTVNCSSGMYSGEGARLCQKQSVVGFSEQTSIISKLCSCITYFPATVAGAVVEVHWGIDCVQIMAKFITSGLEKERYLKYIAVGWI